MDHIPTVQAIYDAFLRGDIDAILAHCADEIEWEAWADNYAQRAGVPWLLPRRGKTGVAEFFGVLGIMEFREFRVLSFLQGDDKVAVEVLADVRTPGGGYRDEELHLFTFNRAGRLVRFRHYLDTAKHIAAAGPSTEDQPDG